VRSKTPCRELDGLDFKGFGLYPAGCISGRSRPQTGASDNLRLHAKRLRLKKLQNFDNQNQFDALNPIVSTL
jgi:hypothetical protein